MALEEITEGHFDGGANLTRGQRGDHGTETTLEEFLGKMKSGRVTAAGAGDEAVAFTTAFADTNYTITLGPGSVSGGTVKDATKAVGGFTIVAGGAGEIGWTAIHD